MKNKKPIALFALSCPGIIFCTHLNLPPFCFEIASAEPSEQPTEKRSKNEEREKLLFHKKMNIKKDKTFSVSFFLHLSIFF